MLTSFLDKLQARHAVIGIVGLGYVGLPLMLRYVEVGFKVIGFDVDQEKVNQLAQGQSYIRHISSDSIGKAVRDNLFLPTTDTCRAGID